MLVHNTFNGFVFRSALCFNSQPRGLFQRRVFHLGFLDAIFDRLKTLRRRVLFTAVNLHYWNLILIAQISPLLLAELSIYKGSIVLAFTGDR